MTGVDQPRGGSADRTTAAGTRLWHEDRGGTGAVILYLLLSVLGVTAVSAPVVARVDALPTAIGIPPFVFLFALLGALTYVFTAVLGSYDSDRRKVFEAGLRIPAALMLAAGVYLVASLVLPGASGAPAGAGGSVVPTTLAAGLAFLVGLYVKLALRALGSVADNLYRGLGRTGG